ncbi:MAG: VanZ family protein [Clostridia bacterium]|nr:VanZ family protein [Clostridia bacterium]
MILSEKRRVFLKVSTAVWLIITLLLMAVIFMFSSAPAAESDAESGRVISFILKLIGTDISVMSPEDAAAIMSRMNFFVRKAAHFTEFAALGFSLLHFTDLLRLSFGFPKPGAGFMISLLTGVCYAFSDEFHQFFSDGRAPRLSDVLIDSAGVISGISVCLLICLIYIKISEKKQKP